MFFLKWKVNPIFSVTDVTSVTNFRKCSIFPSVCFVH